MRHNRTPPVLIRFFMNDGDWGVCYIVWENNKKNSPIFIFRVIVKNSSKMRDKNKQKWPYLEKSKSEKSETWFFFLDSTDSASIMWIWAFLKKKLIFQKYYNIFEEKKCQNFLPPKRPPKVFFWFKTCLTEMALAPFFKLQGF